MKNLLVLLIFLTIILSENLFSAGRDIFMYIDNNDYENVIREIESMNDVNITDHESFNNTPLMEVAFKLENEDSRYQSIALMLLKKGANPNYRNAFGTDALHYAVKLHSTDTFLANCHQYGADLETRYYLNQETLLHSVMENNHYQAFAIIKYLINHTKLVNVPTKRGLTPLMLAMMNNCRPYEGCGFKREQIRDLVNGGALVEVEDFFYHYTALEFGVESMNETYVDDFQDLAFLIDHGAVVDQDALALAHRPGLIEFLKRYL
ncbi:MAG: hypothetical protein A2381_05245 [Bdellovibrionales bacterium RIFOXYB1_FULL_37_110]|nr:MAG: hypothetical protein A2417_16725 [Bdellovibrionales bacterium RIFOXYC1_FULL_37_79]OFZ58151.1 MAG: hypothetical protein A2381_05245 [Bdellovibrionales bacterium RIFOXYB1_FULL_37_110]OFZ61840.1 MAG: hypothetical protein A2577_18830 [Bdellovibrionales bacterium RIFOXYD1_FULL_36_51]